MAVTTTAMTMHKSEILFSPWSIAPSLLRFRLKNVIKNAGDNGDAKDLK